MRIILSHMDKRSYLCLIRKCTPDKAHKCSYCSKNPVRHIETMKFLDKYNIFTPTPSIIHKDHFMSYLDTKIAIDRGLAQPLPDQYCPSLESTSPEIRCKECALGYIFKSKAEYDQHNGIFHHKMKRPPAEVDGPPAKVWKCTCNLAFPSQYRMMQHKHKEGHLMKRGRPKK